MIENTVQKIIYIEIYKLNKDDYKLARQVTLGAVLQLRSYGAF